MGEGDASRRERERERERTRNRTTHGEHHNRTVTGFPDLAHPLQSLILAFMLRLSTYTLHSLPSLQHRLATSATSSSSSFVRSSSSSRCAMSRSASSPSASCSRFPRAPLLPLYYPIPALVRTSPPCAVASCHSRGRAKYHPPGDRFIIYLYNKTSYNNTTFLFSTFKGRPHQPVS